MVGMMYFAQHGGVPSRFIGSAWSVRTSHARSSDPVYRIALEVEPDQRMGRPEAIDVLNRRFYRRARSAAL